ncbi:MAG: hypothetical protein LBE56_12585 [Tannerella sp.]|jgi:hypothetical protein|nr:hypothetical protein [Tannerella sp.]
MAAFSQDQFRQFYAVLKFNNTDPKVDTWVTAGDAGFGKNATNTQFWLNYASPNGVWEPNATGSRVQVTRGDIIHKDRIVYAKMSTAGDRPLQRMEVVLNPTLNSGAPIIGQDYLLNFVFTNLNIGGPENQYFKTGASYRARTGDTAAIVYNELADSAKRNFSRESYPYVHVYTDTWDPWTTPKPATSTSTKIIVEEVLQPYARGKRSGNQVPFSMVAAPVIDNGSYVAWGNITNTTATNAKYSPSGRIVADMEWFYLGQRAEQFRFDGYNNFETVYLTDPTASYDSLDIEFY